MCARWTSHGLSLNYLAMLILAFFLVMFLHDKLILPLRSNYPIYILATKNVFVVWLCPENSPIYAILILNEYNGPLVTIYDKIILLCLPQQFILDETYFTS